MDKKKKSVNQKETLVKVLRYIKPYGFLMTLTIIMAVASVALTLYLPILTGRAVDWLVLIFDPSPLDVDSPWPYLFQLLKQMGIVIVLTALTQWIMNICNNKIVYNVIQDIRKKAFRRIQELPLGYLDSHSHGDIMSRVVADVDQFADGLLIGFTQLFTGVVTILGTLGFMLSVNVGITLVVVIITPVSLFVASFIAKKTFTMFKLQSETRGEQTSLINEMIGNQKVVQAFNREEKTLEKFDEINGRLEKYSLRAIFFSSLTNPCTRFVNSLVYTGVALTGALSALRGGISIGQLTCFLSYANQYTKPFNEISGVITELQNALACAARIFELIEEQPEKKDSGDAVVLKDVRGQVALSDVSFSYVKEKELITGLNLSVKPGQRIAIVGPTGCGKTTIINLLMRFYDADEGHVFIDGKDVRIYDKDELHRLFGVVFQNDVIFADSLKENISFGRDVEAEEMRKAAGDAMAREFIESYEDTYDHRAVVRGANLSGGQRQRVLIARALAAAPRILVLDDSSSALDYKTDAALRKAIREHHADTTTIIIAQRISSIMALDDIIMLDEGKIIGHGTHEELLRNCPMYREIYRNQMGG